MNAIPLNMKNDSAVIRKNSIPPKNQGTSAVQTKNRFNLLQTSSDNSSDSDSETEELSVEIEHTQNLNPDVHNMEICSETKEKVQRNTAKDSTKTKNKKKRKKKSKAKSNLTRNNTKATVAATTNNSNNSSQLNEETAPNNNLALDLIECLKIVKSLFEKFNFNNLIKLVKIITRICSSKNKLDTAFNYLVTFIENTYAASQSHG